MENAQAAKEVSGSLLLRGVLTLLFGIAAVFWPGITIVTLLYLFSAFVLVNGIFDLIFGIGRLFKSSESFTTKLLPLLLGILQVGVGVYLLRHPQVGFATFILLIGFTFVVRGVFELISGLFENAPGSYKAFMIIGGLLSTIVGVVVLFQPVAGGVAFVWVLGVYALISGPMLIALAHELKKSAELQPAKK
jgi:uncharacterized membrane protein HdeD (DUF308 family)